MKYKTQIVLIGMLCSLFSIKVNAQNENARVFKDSILITPNANCKIFLVGYNIKKLVKYTRFDTLKTMLIADVEIARKNPSYPATSKTTHYFVSANGKRRLKAEGEDYPEPEIDIKKEKQSLEMDLPPYLYIIHDFKTGYECFIYLKEPADLNELNNISFSDALSFVISNWQFRKRYRFDIELKNDKWTQNDSINFRHQKDLVEIGPLLSAGAGLIGSQLSPVLGFDLSLSTSNKYGIPIYINQFGFSGYTFTQFNNLEIGNIYPVLSYTDKLIYRISNHSVISPGYTYLGLEFGWFRSKPDGSLNKANKYGIVIETDKLELSLDAIVDKKKNAYFGLTATIPFYP